MKPTTNLKMGPLTPAMVNLRHAVLTRRTGLLVALGACVADLASKFAVLAASTVTPFSLWVIPHQLGLQLQWNTGMSFSLLQNTPGGTLLLAGVGIVASLWFVYWLADHPDALHQSGVGLVLGGALGNLFDRLVHGAVVDFLIISPLGLFPYTFNIADACITVGVGLLLLHGFLTRKA